MFYLDASVIVAAFTREARTNDARLWLRSHAPVDVSLSSWAITEAMSGLSQKVRRGDISAEERTVSTSQIHALTNRHSRTPVSEEHFLAAQRLLAVHETGLRAGDALHLAIAADFDLTPVTLDKTMAAAASSLGLASVLL